MTVPTEVAHQRARLANASRRGDPAAVDSCRRDLAAAKLETYIRRTVEQAPPLSAEVRARLAAVLLTSGGEPVDA